MQNKVKQVVSSLATTVKDGADKAVEFSKTEDAQQLKQNATDILKTDGVKHALGGAAAGAVAGSVLPILGTATGATIGATVGIYKWIVK